MAKKAVHVDIVQLLLERGANVHANNDYALRWASRRGYINVVRILVLHGANIHADDDYAIRLAADFFARYLANVNVDEVGVDYHNRVENIRRLVARIKPRPNYTDDRFTYPVTFCVDVIPGIVFHEWEDEEMRELLRVMLFSIQESTSAVSTGPVFNVPPHLRDKIDPRFDRLFCQFLSEMHITQPSVFCQYFIDSDCSYNFGIYYRRNVSEQPTMLLSIRFVERDL